MRKVSDLHPYISDLMAQTPPVDLEFPVVANGDVYKAI